MGQTKESDHKFLYWPEDLAKRKVDLLTGDIFTEKKQKMKKPKKTKPKY